MVQNKRRHEVWDFACGNHTFTLPLIECLTVIKKGLQQTIYYLFIKFINWIFSDAAGNDLDEITDDNYIEITASFWIEENGEVKLLCIGAIIGAHDILITVECASELRKNIKVLLECTYQQLKVTLSEKDIGDIKNVREGSKFSIIFVSNPT